jgi:hypothetical protein
MLNLVEILNSNDLRFLLKVDELPENYNTEYLIPVLDAILKEDEQLTGTNYYTNFLEDKSILGKDKDKLIAIRGIRELLFLGEKEKVSKHSKTFKLRIETLKDCEKAQNRIIQKLQIRAVKEQEKKEGKASFGAMCARVNIALKINPKDATVAEFREYENLIKQQSKDNG